MLGVVLSLFSANESSLSWPTSDGGRRHSHHAQAASPPLSLEQSNSPKSNKCLQLTQIVGEALKLMELIALEEELAKTAVMQALTSSNF